MRSYPSLVRLLLVAAASLGLFAACNRTSPVDQAAAENMLLITVGSEPSTLDPHRNTGSPEGFIISALWEPLVDWNETATDYVPAAAERWEISDDGRIYTFHLRPDAKWSNGDPVIAQHWVRSLQRWLTPSMAAELGNFADPLVGAHDFRTGKNTDPSSLGIRALDPLTLQLELIEPDVKFFDYLTGWPWIPVHEPSITAAGGFFNAMADFIRPGELITNGAFVLSAWKHGQYVEVARNPHYHGQAKLSSIRFISMENTDTMERSFRSGQLHIIDGLPSSKIDVYREAQDPALVSYPRVGTRFLSFNTTRAPFDDVRVRRAFALSLNRQQLMDVVLRTGGQPAYSFVGPIKGKYEPTVLLQESIDEARTLLAAAGYPDGQGFPPVEYLYNTLDRNRQVAEAIQQMWKAALGVNISLRNEEWKVFLDTRHQLDYHIARSGWLPFSPEPAELYELNSGWSPSNETGWSNREYDRILNLARREMVLEKRYSLYHQLDEILLKEQPTIPFGFYARSRLIDPSVEGWPANHVEGIVWTRIGFRD
ncbi:peptide ABC transporter substrate-binding protein [Opitutaceae bacterium]|nr:peptide ABC transporter substrate-binding protein [Opitutaceae bacterium]